MIDNASFEMMPRFTNVVNFRADTEYADWFSEIKRSYYSAQVRASFKVNVEKLCFNWSVGRDLVIRKAEEKWGSGVVDQLSFDLREAFPADKGFSSRNLWNMKGWYLFFSSDDAVKRLHQLGAELQLMENHSLIKLHQLGAEIDPDFPLVLGLVPWRHQINKIKYSVCAVFCM